MMMGLRWLGAGAGGAAAAAVVAGNLMAFAVALPFALPLAAGPADAAILVYLGVFQIGIAYPLLLRALRHLSAIEASLLLFVEPVLSPVWAFLVHGERPGAWAIAGGALILAATAAKTALDARAAPASPAARLAGEVGERADEGRAGVQRFRAAEARDQPRRLPRGLDVEVEQHLGVVGDEADGDRDHAARAAGGEGAQRVLHGGADPGLGRAARALERRLVGGQPRRPRHRRRRRPHLARVGVAALDEAHGQACAVKSTVSPAAGRAARSFSAKAATRPGWSCQLSTQRTATPGGTASRSASPYLATLTVENCGASGTPTDLRRAAGHHLRHRVGDERPPVAHPDVRPASPPPSRSESAAACARVMSVSGDRPPMAA